MLVCTSLWSDSLVPAGTSFAPAILGASYRSSCLVWPGGCALPAPYLGPPKLTKPMNP